MSGGKTAKLSGRVRDIVQSGDALVESERGLVFVRGALPGEQVLVSLDPKSKKPLRGRVLRVLEASPARVEAACAAALRCGGCPLMHMQLAEQRALKLRFLRDALRKVGAPQELPVQETVTDVVLRYRRRARLAFQTQGERKLGYRRERSHQLVDIDSCAVLHSVLADALTVLRGELLPQLTGEGELLLAMGKEGGAVLVVRVADAQTPALYATCGSLVERKLLEGIALYAAGASKPALFGDAREWSADVEGVALEGALGGFSQAHADINRQLVERVRSLVAAEGAHVLELYAGHGNFTVGLAHGAASYTAVEQDVEAAVSLRRNLSARQLTAKVVQGDAREAPLPAALDVVLLDPPRAGAAGLLSRLAQRKVKRIVYVSCDPQTLARDLSEVLGKGYRLTWAEAFEMFPQTADLESVVCLTRE